MNLQTLFQWVVFFVAVILIFGLLGMIGTAILEFLSQLFATLLSNRWGVIVILVFIIIAIVIYDSFQKEHLRKESRKRLDDMEDRDY